VKLDRTFVSKIKKQANGDGSRKAKFAFLKKVRGASEMMSCPDVMYGKFDEALQTYGRVPVAVCVAATLYQRREQLDRWKLGWTFEVLNLWTNKAASNLDSAFIYDGIHPTRICEYVGSFIRFTTEEE